MQDFVRETSSARLRPQDFVRKTWHRLPLDEIETVAIVRNHWWNGFGIRRRSGFRLYKVAGLDAVELQLKSRDIRRAGRGKINDAASATLPHPTELR
jgi:hypothetical protein